jgi:hypothetical protein
VAVVAGGEWRRRFDRVDADDRTSESRFVGTDAGGEVGERRLCAQLASELFARGFELASLAAHAARPGVATECVDHRAAHAAFGKGLELDAARLVEPARRIDQAEHPVLHEVAELDGVRHRRGDASGERLDERQSGGNTFTLTGNQRLTLHGSPFCWRGSPRATAVPGRHRDRLPRPYATLSR